MCTSDVSPDVVALKALLFLALLPDASQANF
jgi:hypothetical protein